MTGRVHGCLLCAILGANIVVAFGNAAQCAEPGTRPYDYYRPVENIVAAGMQALMTCNGLFVSGRSLEQLYDEELQFEHLTLVPPEMVLVDNSRRAIAVGVGATNPFPVMRAAYRVGLGCIVMGPEQTFDDIDALPELDMPALPGDPAAIDWPDGDRAEVRPEQPGIDLEALSDAGEFAFDRATHGHSSQVTTGFVIVHRGTIVYERYRAGFDQSTRTRTWSAAKSIVSTLIGIAHDRLELDEPLPFQDWGTGAATGMVSETDPRRSITLRHVLNMSSGLYPVDNTRCNVVGSCLGYFAGVSTVAGALDRGLVHAPGEYWDYENYDSLLAVYALKTALGGGKDYLEFPRRALFDRIGMRTTLAGVDRFGDFVLSSQVYATARDLARLGLLYLNNGVWNGERILSEAWIEFVRTPAPSTVGRGGMYGGHFWLVPEGRNDVPRDAYAMVGGRGQHVVIIPSYELVIVRRGLDRLPQVHPNPPWDLAREVVKAFPAVVGHTE